MKFNNKKRDFNYVQIKVSDITNNDQSMTRFNSSKDYKQKVLIQIIDMNDKILYNETKAEKSFLSLINAAISHELRNPLNSLVGQIVKLKQYLYQFELLK